ncbi:bifunctional oligoribonuclease/PAP phosphatase NrnA [Pseudomonas sp. CF161]|uniref:DHH family phosphoesterase n=1 Tax=Pseudomonas sp. CF161 TaxID=911241 RepID=UPI0003550AA8|nr:DHH family phosphoesterase [Pseudomonas sp. CF161]EPL03490.1 DHH family protein [Pseudomonas sp. CF161]
MIIVTSGSAYLDIDAYACCIAYAELLNRQGRSARAVSSAPLNESVAASLRTLGPGLDRYVPKPDDEFVLVDISNHLHLDPIVALERVVEVIDHHPGFEEFWDRRLAQRADIRQIGAACTQVFQRWQASGLLASISPASATLLAAGILDNTLNFTGHSCTAADREAYAALAALAGLDPQWARGYFGECQRAIEGQLEQALLKDLKVMAPISNLPRTFAQLTVWDAGQLLLQRRQIEQVLGRQGEDWLLNLISLREHKSYLLTGSAGSSQKLALLVDCPAQDGVRVLDRPVLRKELLRKGLEWQPNN